LLLVPRALPNNAEGPCHHRAMETRSSDGRLTVRIGDAEREECLDALSDHHVWGRLTLDELDRRQRAALTAVTRDDLAGLLADLPSGTSPSGSLAVSEDWWSLAPTVRALRIARWSATPISLAAGGVLVASANPINDESGFAVGFAAAAVGYITHLCLSKWPGKRPEALI
jgi:hypothetical protein